MKKEKVIVIIEAIEKESKDIKEILREIIE